MVSISSKNYHEWVQIWGLENKGKIFRSKKNRLLIFGKYFKKTIFFSKFWFLQSSWSCLKNVLLNLEKPKNNILSKIKV
jgi:hypothetical protein